MFINILYLKIIFFFLLSDVIGMDMDILIFILMIIVMSIIAILLDKWGKIIKLLI